MKKIMGLFTALFLVLGLSACGGGDAKKSETSSDCKTTTVLVTDKTGVDDKSFNQGAYEGLQKFATELKDKGACNASSITSSSEAAYETNVASVSGKKNDLVVAAGFTFKGAIETNATKFPTQKYLLIDDVAKGDNVVSAVFAQEQGSFLAGVAAAETAKAAGKNQVGFIGGMESPVITGFEVGFTQGVKAVDKNMKVEVNYVGAFDDASKAKSIATQMYANGTYIIFIAAGGAGNGVINAAKELVEAKKDAWVIGVDRDQYGEGKVGDKSVILTSMVKRADIASFDVASSVLDGTFKGGETKVYDLKTNGVGLPEKNPNLSEAVLKVVDSFKAKIISGEIKVSATK